MSKSGTQFDIEPSPTDTISCLTFSPNSTHLLVGSWDSHLYIYTRQQQQEEHGGSQPFTLHRTLDVEVPILSACWGSDESQIFASTLQGEVLSYTLSDSEEEPEPTILSEHTQGANKLAYSPTHDLLLSTSWDETLHVHSPSTSKHLRARLAAKPFALNLSLASSRAVVAMAERKVSVYDLGALKSLVDQQAGSTSDSQDVLNIEPWQDRLSNLKFMARDVACNPDGSGFATSSIEGRVSVEYFSPERDEEKYAFKCHRQTSNLPPSDESPDAEPEKVDVVYPVNTLAFHPSFGTFATGGGDGSVAVWDANTKRRVRQYKDLGRSVSAVEFSQDGKFLGVGVCPGFEDGMEAESVGAEDCKVVLRVLGESEAKGKAKGAKE